jgi:hypothetical protein
VPQWMVSGAFAMRRSLNASRWAIRMRLRTAAAISVRAVGSTDGPVPGVGR